MFGQKGSGGKMVPNLEPFCPSFGPVVFFTMSTWASQRKLCAMTMGSWVLMTWPDCPCPDYEELRGRLRLSPANAWQVGTVAPFPHSVLESLCFPTSKDSSFPLKFFPFKAPGCDLILPPLPMAHISQAGFSTWLGTYLSGSLEVLGNVKFQ